MRRGISVVETTVAILLAVLVLGALYALLSGGVRTYGATDVRLASVTAANAALARLRQDLRCAAGARPRVEDAGAALVLELVQGGARIPVRWYFDRATGRLHRSDEPLIAVAFADVTFRREEPSQLVTVRIVTRRDHGPGPASPVHGLAASVWSEATFAEKEFPDLALQ